MTRFTLLALASLGTAAVAIGCQNSGHAHAEADVDRPRTASTYERTETTATPSAYTTTDVNAYTMPYVARQDTSYMSSPTATSTAGTINRGDVVYFRVAPDTASSNYVAAKTADGRIVYVRASDFRPQ